MEETILHDGSPVRAALEGFIEVKIYTDGPAGRPNRELQEARFGTTTLPLYLFFTPDGREVGRLPLGQGLPSRAEFLDLIARTRDAGR